MATTTARTARMITVCSTNSCRARGNLPSHRSAEGVDTCCTSFVVEHNEHKIRCQRKRDRLVWQPSLFLGQRSAHHRRYIMGRLTKSLGETAAAVTVILVAACSGGSNAGGGDGELGQFRYLVPNSAGSGWDTTARTAAKIMEDDGIAQRIDVFNVDGANGTVGLSRLVDEKNNGELVMQMGFGLVAATVSQSSPVSFA